MGPRMLALAAGLLVTATAFAQEPQVYQPGNGVSAPRLVKDVLPSYTSEALRAKIEGAVHLTAVVREDGSVGNIEITQSLDKKYGLDAEAVKVTKQWTFKPGMREGKAVPVKVTIKMAFTLAR